MLKVVSLCTGIGGLDLAAEWANMEIVGQVEIDPFCIKVLEKHWPHVRRVADLFNVKGDEFGAVDIVCAGFPCQPYSVAGKRRGKADDRAIWPEVLRCTLAFRPTFCLFENVAGFIAMALDDVCLDLEAAGYEVQPVVLPACGVGAWHRRERVFIIGHDTLSHPTGGESDGRERGIVAGAAAGRRGGDTAALIGRQDVPDASGVRGAAIEWHESHGDVSGHADVPDADRGRCEQRDAAERGVPIADAGGTDAAHANQPGPQGHGRCGDERDGAGEWIAWQGGRPLESIWQSEPAVGRVAHGVPKRVDRLRSLGNAVVPEQAYPIFAAIAATYDLSQFVT